MFSAMSVNGISDGEMFKSFCSSKGYASSSSSSAASSSPGKLCMEVFLCRDDTDGNGGRGGGRGTLWLFFCLIGLEAAMDTDCAVYISFSFFIFFFFFYIYFSQGTCYWHSFVCINCFVRQRR